MKMRKIKILKGKITRILLFGTSTFLFCQSSLLVIPDIAVNQEETLFIITTSKYEKTLSDFIEWKRERGLDVEIDVQSAGRGVHVIQETLQDKYEETGLTYILLVGDIDDVPSPLYQGYPSDPSYALLDGDDFIGDAFISRIPVNTVGELENQINKILTYEKALFKNTEWINTAIIPQTIEFDGHEHAQAIVDAMESQSQYFKKVIKIMEDGPDPEAALIDAIEKYGVNMLVYNSHGQENGFGNIRFTVDDVRKIIFPEGCFPIIHGCGCLTGNFAYEGGDCLAEAALKTGSIFRPAGPIAMLAFTSPANPGPAMVAQKELFTNMYYNDEYDTFGELCYYSNLYAMRQYNDYEAERHYRKCHLFGDCSMIVWKVVPDHSNLKR